MANATDTRSSPRYSSSSSGGGGGGDSPQSQSRRNGKNNSSNLSAPWSHVVRGESETTIPAGQSSSEQQVVPESMMMTAGVVAETISSSLLESSSSSSSVMIDAQMDSSDINVAPMKKPAWNKPSNGVVEVGAVVMGGASSWPALSESTKASPKSSSDSLKALSDGSVSVTQGPVIASVPQKQVNANPNSTPNHTYTRQKSMKRGGSGSGSGGGGGGGGGSGGGGPVNGGFNQPPPLPSPSTAVETQQQNSSGKSGPVVMDSSPREQQPHYKGNNNWEGGPRGGGGGGGGFMSQPSHNGNDHPQQHRFRRHNNNNGPHPNSYGGGRHNQDREWNSHRNFNGRNVHMQHQRVPGNFQRAPPPSTPPFISPQPVPPFQNPLGFPVYYVGPPPDSLRGMSMVPAPSMMYLPPPAPDAQLRARIVKQIDYYFSPENLCKDTYLRQNMDDQGWVSISVIAPWNRVRQLTTNIQFILDALRASQVVEVQGDKLRKRIDWMNWPRLPQNQFVSAPVAQSSGVSNHDMLADRFKNVKLEEGKSANVSITTRSQADTTAVPAMSRSSSEDLNNLPSNVQWGGPEQATVRLGSD